MPRVELEVVRAAGLPCGDVWGKVDPYCAVRVEGRCYRTKEADSTANPSWGETLVVPVSADAAKADSTELLHFIVWDADWGKDDALGHCFVPVGSLPAASSGVVAEERRLDLLHCKSPQGELHVRVLLHTDDALEPSPEDDDKRELPERFGAAPAVSLRHHHDAATRSVAAFLGRELFLESRGGRVLCITADGGSAVGLEAPGGTTSSRGRWVLEAAGAAGADGAATAFLWSPEARAYLRPTDDGLELGRGTPAEFSAGRWRVQQVSGATEPHHVTLIPLGTSATALALDDAAGKATLGATDSPSASIALIPPA